MDIIGCLTEDIIKMFELKYEPDTKIYMDAGRKKHILKHKDEFTDFEKTYSSIAKIIKEPDFVGIHPNKQSIEYIKKLDENVLVAVRLNDKLNVRTMYAITEIKLNNYIKSGRTKKIVVE